MPAGDSGAPLQTQATAAADERIAPPIHGDFTAETLLGTGGFASVWAARMNMGDARTSAGRAIAGAPAAAAAIKVGQSGDRWIQRRFAAEASAMRTVGAPPAPAYISRGILEDGRPYIAMERLFGQSLAAAIEQPQAPPMAWVLQIASALIDTLAHVHARGMVHRDIKPENVFLTTSQEAVPTTDTDSYPNDSTLRLIDFGLAELRYLDDIGDRARAGSLAYMAPEQIRGDGGVDPRTDIYGFGALVYELLTLRPPFVGTPAAVEYGHLYLRPMRPSRLARVPDAIEDLVLSCLAKDPHARPGSVAALREQWIQASRSHSRSGLRDDRQPRSDDSMSMALPRPLSETPPNAELLAAQQLVALLLVDTPAGLAALTPTVQGHGGFVARQRPGRIIAVFAQAHVDDPARTALNAARDIEERFGGRMALHVAPLAMRARRRGPPAVMGPAIDQVTSWLPSKPWQGLIVTREVARSLPSGSTHPWPNHAGFAIPVGDSDSASDDTSLIGHQDVLAQVAETVRGCVDTRRPALVTLVASHGMGRSRLLREIAALARQLAPTARVRLSSADQPLAPPPPRIASAAHGPHGLQVVLVDDIHRADNALLERIERLTLDNDDIPLCAVVTALPSLFEIRPRWGQRANRHQVIELGPLSVTQARTLAAELLAPAEYPPTEFLDQLTEWADRRPDYISEIVAELKHQGIVRPRPGKHSWYVAVDEFHKPAASAASQWLANRELDAMPVEMAACLRLCSVLGSTFSVHELATIQDAIERHGGAGTTIDTEVGLGEFVSRGLLRTGEDGHYRFTRSALRDALYQSIADGDRHAIHGHAADYWRERCRSQSADANRHTGQSVLPHTTTTEDPQPHLAMTQLAHHAAAAGRVREAAQAFSRLGDDQYKHHHYVQAEYAYSQALKTAPDTAVQLRAAALLGRGRVRYRINRSAESLMDLRQARALAQDMDDHLLALTARFEEATALDWAAEYEQSRNVTMHAIEEVQKGDIPALEPHCLLAQGRMYWRNERIAEAADVLSQALDRARYHQCDEIEVVAMLLLASVDLVAGRLDQAEDHFSRVIDRCSQNGDQIHLCAAYSNRMLLWSARREIDRAVADLRQAAALARHVGNPLLEASAVHNLAELLFWSGEDDESLSQALRAHRLHQRFNDRPVAEYPLLSARICAVRGDMSRVAEFLDWIKSHCDIKEIPTRDLMVQALSLILRQRIGPEAHDSAAWEELLGRAQALLPGEEYMELLWWRARLAADDDRDAESLDALKQALRRIDDVPIWQHRILVLADSMGLDL